MTTHILNIERRWYDLLVSGDKTCEVRPNDRQFQRGDRLQFIDISGGDAASASAVSSRPLLPGVWEITHVLVGPCYGIETGHSVLSVHLRRDLESA